MNMLAPINSNYYSTIYPQKSSNVAFGTTRRGYIYNNEKYVNCYTTFFRNDLNWKKFVKYADSNFKNKSQVNVINGACSDGTESYSLAIALKENLSEKSSEKFLPIKAFDYDKEVIKVARSGLILMSDAEMGIVKLATPNDYIYFEDTDEVLDIADDCTAHLKLTKRVSEDLRKDIIFEQKDMFEVLENLEDDSNSIVLFRNAIGHLGDAYANKFATLASKKLKSGSLVVIGNFDHLDTRIVYYLRENNFTEVMPNVFRKNEENTSFIEKIKRFFDKR